MDDILTNSADETLEKIGRLSRNKGLVYRGYSLQAQQLPSLIRDKNYSQFELRYLRRFERHGSQYYFVNSPIDFLATAQHFGLPTRLIDLTHNPYIALYFALYRQKGGAPIEKGDKEFYYLRCFDLKSQIHFYHLPSIHFLEPTTDNSMTMRYGSIIASIMRIVSKTRALSSEIIEDFVNKQLGQIDVDYTTAGIDNWAVMGDFEEWTSEIDFISRAILSDDSLLLDNRASNNAGTTDHKKLVKDAFIRIYESRLIIIEPKQSNQRLISQQGLFLLPYTLDREELLDQINKNSFVIKIHSSQRKELRAYLDHMGFNGYRMMPDLASVCEEIKKSIRDE